MSFLREKKISLGKIRRNDDKGVLMGIEDARISRAKFVYGHLGAYLLEQNVKVAEVIFWDENVKTQNTPTRRKRVGKILLAERPSKVLDFLLREEYLQNFGFYIKEAGNSSRGIDRTTGNYFFTQTNPHLTSTTQGEFDFNTSNQGAYNQLSEMFKQNPEFISQGIESVEGEWVDYALLAGTDNATYQDILIEMGRPPIMKKFKLRKDKVFELEL